MLNKEENPRATPDLKNPPAGYFLVVPPADSESEDAIDPGKVLRILRSHWIFLACMTLIGGATAAVISLQMRNMYRAEAVVSPTAESNNKGGSLKDEVGGIAELAGIDLGGGGGRKQEAMATLMAPGFLREFIAKNDLMPILFDERWDPATKNWRPGKKVPTLGQAAKRLKDDRIVNENTKTGLVTLSVEAHTPELAAKWTNGMIDLVNERLRQADIKTARNSLDYLNRELETATTVELRLAISHLIEQQINNQMMANVQRDYAYHFIDLAVPPEIKDSPKRTLISLGGAFAGLVLGLCFIALKRRFTRARKSG
jgi:LPS O-antigen subunit length determinant protein (WzzB/FepE family)